MSTPRTTIFSPDSVLIERLQSTLREAGFADSPAAVPHYPSNAELSQAIDATEQGTPVVFVDMVDQEKALRLVRKGARENPKALIIAANGTRQLSALARAKEAGVWGYLVDPLDLGPLSEHFGVGTSSSGSQPSNRLVSFLPAQGGNGASTVATHVATAVASRLGGSTLLMDCDFHSGAIAFQLGLDAGCSIAYALREPPKTLQAWDECTCAWEQLRVLVGPGDPDEAMGAAANTDQLLDSATIFHSCSIADLAGPVDTSSAQILKRSDRIYVVSTPEITSLHIAKRKAERMRRIGIADERVRLLLNRVGAQGSLDIARAGEVVGLPVEWTVENDYQAVRSAAWKGGLVPGDTKLGSQMRHLGLQIIDELEMRKDEAIAA